jgi:hypothetical protein
MATFEAEEFWDDLLAFIEEGRVIPVVGAELLTIQLEGSLAVPLYRAVADRLLTIHKLRSLPQEHYGLYDTVAAVAAERRVRMKDLYRQIHDILKKLLAEQGPLRELTTSCSELQLDNCRCVRHNTPIDSRGIDEQWKVRNFYPARWRCSS